MQEFIKQKFNTEKDFKSAAFEVLEQHSFMKEDNLKYIVNYLSWNKKYCIKRSTKSEQN